MSSSVEKILTLDQMVRVVLAADPDSRNSDIRLTQVIWWKYYREKIQQRDGKFYVAIDDLFELPREDNIKRCRAQIQNVEKKWLPTSWEIARQRKWREDVWRDYVKRQDSLF